jgi:hypothetical protein
LIVVHINRPACDVPMTIRGEAAREAHGICVRIKTREYKSILAVENVG